MDKKEQTLKELGFKRVWFDDKSGYWFVKPVKIGGFNGYFYYDNLGHHHLVIKGYKDPSDKIYESGEELIIWYTKSFSSFVKKVKSHE